MILGVSCSLSEAEPHWRDFIHSLKQRGIGIPDSVTSDAHEGLKAALRATLNASPWQRCQFHLQQNAQAYVPSLAIGVGMAVAGHPSLRTGLADFPHPALQSVSHPLVAGLVRLVWAKAYREISPSFSKNALG